MESIDKKTPNKPSLRNKSNDESSKRGRKIAFAQTQSYRTFKSHEPPTQISDPQTENVTHLAKQNSSMISKSNEKNQDALTDKNIITENITPFITNFSSTVIIKNNENGFIGSWNSLLSENIRSDSMITLGDYTYEQNDILQKPSVSLLSVNMEVSCESNNSLNCENNQAFTHMMTSSTASEIITREDLEHQHQYCLKKFHNNSLPKIKTSSNFRRFHYDSSTAPWHVGANQDIYWNSTSFPNHSDITMPLETVQRMSNVPYSTDHCRKFGNYRRYLSTSLAFSNNQRIQKFYFAKRPFYEPTTFLAEGDSYKDSRCRRFHHRYKPLSIYRNL